MNIRSAPIQFVLQIKRRLEKTMPGAVLDEASVKLISLPHTQFDATVFMFRDKDAKVRLVAELARPDLPHIYAGKTIHDPKSRRELAGALVWVCAHLGYKILNDARFSRGNIIQLSNINGFAHARA